MPYKTWLWVGVLLVLPWVAHAAGLGRLTILSALGRPLLAEVELISVQKDELATLTARMASPEAFTQANIRYSPALVGVRLSIERRSDGRPYIKIVSTRPVNDPFIDLLIELNWAQGRLVREYTALIDPPGYAPEAPLAQIVPAVTPQPSSLAAPAPVEAATPAARVPSAASSAEPSAVPPAKRRIAARRQAGSKEYGPVKGGEALSSIAVRLKPEGVTLEQMLVSLYRNNPDAFYGNMNRLKAGTILRIPEEQQIAAIEQSEAAKEMRVQAADWKSYRQRLADAAGTTPPRESGSAASGKITSAVDDKAVAKESPKEVLKLSKGEVAVSGKAGKGKDAARPTERERLRILEEEAAARAKAVTEANERIAHLEKTIQDLQRLLEIKGQVPGLPAGEAQRQPAPGVKPEAAPLAKGGQAAQPEPAKSDAAKTEPARTGPVDARQITAEASGGNQQASPAAPPAASGPLQGGVPNAEAPKSEPGAPVAPKPKPQPQPIKSVAAPDLVDEVLAEPLYLAGGGGLLALLGGVGYWFARRRSAHSEDDEVEVEGERIAPLLGKEATAVTAPVAGGEDEVDPLAEADLYLSFGRDEQAEEVLKEVLEGNPANEEAQLKLLQIYSERNDRAAFEKIARNLHARTKGTGENWRKAAALGNALDPSNVLYGAAKQAPGVAMASAGGAAPAGADVEWQPASTVAETAPLDPDSNSSLVEQLGKMARAVEAQEIAREASAPQPAAETAPARIDADFMLNFPDEVPPASSGAPGGEARKTDVTSEPAAPLAGTIDFDLDDATASAQAAPAGGKDDIRDGTIVSDPGKRDQSAGIDFEIDTAKVGAASDTGAATTKPVDMTPVFSDFKLEFADNAAAPPGRDLRLDEINLNLDDTATGAASKAPAADANGKDNHWYDVQTKFDLAKAYEEMGDKDGAREILQEVINEGDPGQQAAAKKLLESLVA